MFFILTIHALKQSFEIKTRWFNDHQLRKNKTNFVDLIKIAVRKW